MPPFKLKFDRVSGITDVEKIGKIKVTVPVHGKKEIKPKTLNSIFKQAGWK